MHREVFKRQNGGSGSFAEIHFELLPVTNGAIGLEFVNDVKGGAIPREFISSVKKGFEEAMKNGVLAGYPLESLRVANAQWIDAEVPLANLFGYVTALRTVSSGRASASLTFCRYQLVPDNIAETVLAKSVM